MSELNNLNSLSALAKRMARSSADGSPSETSAETFHTHERSDPTLGASFMSAVTGVKRANPSPTNVVGAHLERLIPAHNDTGLASHVVLHKTDVASSALLPLHVALVEPEELCAPGVNMVHRH